MSRWILGAAGALCIALCAIGVRHATFGGEVILSWLGCMLLPLPVFVVVAWIAREELDWTARRRANVRAPRVEIPPEQHLVVAALARPADTRDVPALLATMRDAKAFFYARGSGADLHALAAPFHDRAVRVETTASYRNTAFRDRSQAGAGDCVVVMAFETPVTHSSAAPPEDLGAMRALLARIGAQPIAEGAVVHILPRDGTESLTSEAVRELFPELRLVPATS